MSILLLSYFEADSELAQTIAEVVSDYGIECVGSRKAGSWTRAHKEQFDEELLDCLSLLVVLSPESASSQWLPYEVGYGTAGGKHVLCYKTSRANETPLYVSCCEILDSIHELRRHLEGCKHATALRESAASPPR